MGYRMQINYFLLLEHVKMYWNVIEEIEFLTQSTHTDCCKFSLKSVMGLLIKFTEGPKT